MNKPAVYFALAAALMTAGFAALAIGQATSDRRAYVARSTLRLARAVAFVAGEEQRREDEAAAGQTQRFVVAMKQALPTVREISVVKGTKLLAHSDEARAGQRLDPESLTDKELYDAAGRLKATLGKNAEERERRPELKHNAYAEVEVEAREDGAIRAAAPVVIETSTDAAVPEVRFIAGATVIAAPVPPPFEVPFLILVYAAVASALFFGLSRMAKGAVAYVVGGSLVLALLAADVFALANARDAQRRSEAAAEAQLHAALAEAGLLRATAVDRFGALPVALSAEPMGEGRGDLVAIRSSTVGAAPIPGAVRFEHAPYEILFSGAFFEAERGADRGHLFQWGAAFALIALLAFILGGLGQLSKGWRSFVKHRHAYYYMAPAMIGMAILVFIPVVFGIVLGFMDRRYNVFEFAGLSNYIAILSDLDVTNPQNFYFKLAVTVMWTVTNVSLHVSIGLFLALLLNDQLLKARGIFRVLLIIPWAIPNYITALIWRGLFHKQFGAINIVLEALGVAPVAWFQSFWPAFFTNLATNTWLGFPFMMVVSLGALQSIPGDLYEAAWVDGASRWQRFAKITLPLLMPALVPAVIMGTVWTFNMFNIIYLVSGGAPNGATDILITDAFRWAFERDRYGYAAAYSTLIFLLLLTFTVATNRITGATKGAFE